MSRPETAEKQIIRFRPGLRSGVFLFALTALTACSPRADLIPDAAARDAGNPIPIYVGTTRARDEGTVFSKAQPDGLNYAVVNVSVPPDRAPGVVKVPSGKPDASTDFLTRDVMHYPDRGAFRAAARRALAARTNPRDEIVVTVHGFNNTAADGVFRAAQMAEDFGITGPVFHYAWPSRGEPLGYAADRDAALIARDGLEEMLHDLRDAGARDIVLVAHSMGTQLTMEVLRQMALRGDRATLSRLGGVVLMSPDIDPVLFRRQVEEIGDLPQPFVIFSSSRDPALRLSARLTGHDDRLGNITSVDAVAGLDVTVIDLSGTKDAASRHLAAATSPTLIGFLNGSGSLLRSLKTDATGKTGVLPGTVLLAQEATAVILAPVVAIEQELE
ncbi:alpha/beta hydrolase [Lutimaribacter marinistellae]|uniref:Alpha/beta hydrolase n=1 Tax=Lutimaribacter marinistellae TaxID=1820329 RepID=A0ABV7TEC0_9RHOB